MNRPTSTVEFFNYVNSGQTTPKVQQYKSVIVIKVNSQRLKCGKVSKKTTSELREMLNINT